MTSPAKINLFEFLQGELETRLDDLDKRTDQPLESFLTEDSPIALTSEYWEHRSNLITLYEAVRDNYEKIMKDAEAGFP